VRTVWTLLVPVHGLSAGLCTLTGRVHTQKRNALAAPVGQMKVKNGIALNGLVFGVCRKLCCLAEIPCGARRFDSLPRGVKILGNFTPHVIFWTLLVTVYQGAEKPKNVRSQVEPKKSLLR